MRALDAQISRTHLELTRALSELSQLAEFAAASRNLRPEAPEPSLAQRAQRRSATHEVVSPITEPSRASWRSPLSPIRVESGTRIGTRFSRCIGSPSHLCESELRGSHLRGSHIRGSELPEPHVGESHLCGTQLAPSSELGGPVPRADDTQRDLQQEVDRADRAVTVSPRRAAAESPGVVVYIRPGFMLPRWQARRLWSRWVDVSRSSSRLKRAESRVWDGVGDGELGKLSARRLWSRWVHWSRRLRRSKPSPALVAVGSYGGLRLSQRHALRQWRRWAVIQAEEAFSSAPRAVDARAAAFRLWRRHGALLRAERAQLDDARAARQRALEAARGASHCMLHLWVKAFSSAHSAALQEGQLPQLGSALGSGRSYASIAACRHFANAFAACAECPIEVEPRSEGGARSGGGEGGFIFCAKHQLKARTGWRLFSLMSSQTQAADMHASQRVHLSAREEASTHEEREQCRQHQPEQEQCRQHQLERSRYHQRSTASSRQRYRSTWS